ncbi:hypothetical protein Vadar_005138 [Vaccinium darrowii]|uniref:Uncharacterized protein n=1 Tax=Vaccinium darrowii TaxID=229202 RepID=A0ACB7YJE8_9ERIC|nr:hypothetical protein Vadar_005138 [Vaccinium darrowii]
MDPHVLIFPLPLQSPIKSMLKLAELLCLAGDIAVTFLNTDQLHRRLLSCTNIHSHFSKYPQFRFETISDGLAEDNPRTADRFMELIDGMEAVTKPLFREMMVNGGCLSSSSEKPVTCIITDGPMSFVFAVTEEVGIPLIYFDTISPSALWTYFCFPKLIDACEIPITGHDLDAPVKNVPGMEGFLRRRDLPSFCRAEHLKDSDIQFYLNAILFFPRSQGLVLNTFEELDGSVISGLRSFCPNLYPIGPIHAHLKNKLASQVTPPPTASSSLWKEDWNCIEWLDVQSPKSVIYVSIGSQAVMTKDQLLEFWHGLVNSGHRFLWVIRSNSIAGENSWEGRIPNELLEATKMRGCLVTWAPQEEVLAHPSVGGFLTHNGWNSTLESVVEGVPMLCWPCFLDQQVTSRFVSEVWKLGIDMKDTCDRAVIETMIRNLMGVRRDEFVESAKQMAKLARESVSEGGSSSTNLNSLIEYIRLVRLVKV